MGASPSKDCFVCKHLISQVVHGHAFFDFNEITFSITEIRK